MTLHGEAEPHLEDVVLHELHKAVGDAGLQKDLDLVAHAVGEVAHTSARTCLSCAVLMISARIGIAGRSTSKEGVGLTQQMLES